MTIAVLYRYEGICWSAGVDEYGDPLPYRGRRSIHCHEYPVIRTTKCGVWIAMGCGEKKFVNLQATKQYACVSKFLALESFRARKRRAIAIMRARIADCEDFLKCADKELVDA